MAFDSLQTNCPALMRSWLTDAIEADASDLHIIGDHPPVRRIHGKLQETGGTTLDDQAVRENLMPLCPEPLVEQFQVEKNIDFSLMLDIDGTTRRFRVNYFLAGQTMGGCFRVIPAEIPDFHWAGFPKTLAERVAGYRNGLVLVTGVTGSGKTTSLAMIIDLMNQRSGYRIITVEEPVEYLFPKAAGSLVTQREVGADVHTFADGLKYGLRQDPDVILVGEIRDRETAQMALSAAETGHLVFATMHTRDAKGAISRYADLFPQDAQHVVRSQLSLGLRAVISQHLLPSAYEGHKRALALETLFTNSAIASSIRFGKLESIDNHIVTGRSDGMIPLDESLKRLLREGEISRETFDRYATDVAKKRATRH